MMMDITVAAVLMQEVEFSLLNRQVEWHTYLTVPVQFYWIIVRSIICKSEHEVMFIK